MLTYDTFVETVKERILEFLPAEFSSSTVNIVQSIKNNITFDSITITSPNGSNVCPTIHLNNFYEMYSKGYRTDEILSEIAKVRVECEARQPENIDLDWIMDYNLVKDKVFARMYGAKRNRKMLEDSPYTLVEDIAVLYYISIKLPVGEGSIRVTNEILTNWGITKEVLHNQAVENNKNYNPSVFEGMVEMLLRKFPDCMETRMIPPTNEETMYVLSNENHLYGAAALLDVETMRKVRDKIGDDFYILPSSVHEVIVVPVARESAERLESMVREVNSTEVLPEEKLSDYVYKYDFAENVIYRAI